MIEEICRSCRGSGTTTAMHGGLGPDDYEIEISCPKCGGTGALPVGVHPEHAPITDKLIDDMLHGNGIPRCDEWDKLVRHAKTMEMSFYRTNREIDLLETDCAAITAQNTALVKALRGILSAADNSPGIWTPMIEPFKIARETLTRSTDRRE